VVKIYVAAVKALSDNERGDETQFNIKIGGKTSLGASCSVCKFSFLVKQFIPYYAETGRSHPLIA
jgi:hypothetical protein